MASDAFQWNETIGELLKYALVRRSREQRALSIHRLVQTVIKDAINKQRQRQWAECTVRAVNAVFPDVQFEEWPMCERYLPHALVCADLVEQENLMLLDSRFDHFWTRFPKGGIMAKMRGENTLIMWLNVGEKGHEKSSSGRCPQKSEMRRQIGKVRPCKNERTAQDPNRTGRRYSAATGTHAAYEDRRATGQVPASSWQ